jgi:hypothetical protein
MTKQLRASKPRGTEDAIELADYRKQTDLEGGRFCSNCVYRQRKEDGDNWCGLFEFFFNEGWICDEHRFRDTGF